MLKAPPNFSAAEYGERLAKTRRAMVSRGIDTLILTDPSNMNWLTGYDGWSFYVHQCVVISQEGALFWYGRAMDRPGALKTSWLPDEDLLSYPETYVQTPERHPMDHLVSILESRGLSRGRIGVEMDNYYYSARTDAILRSRLGEASFVDATGLVNWQRAVKSPTELDYMKIAGRIVSAAHRRAFELVEPGIPKNRVVAEIFRTLTMGVDGHSGDYSAFMPIVPSAADASAPHLTWDEKPMKTGEGTYFELGGCHKRYHCPQCRTIFLGKPTDAFLDAEKATLEGMEAGLSMARPGNTCGDIAEAYFAILGKRGITKTSRAGYATGLSYPPDWGERTLSIRPGDRTVLEPGMTIHFMTGLWLADMGFELTETIAITESGYELLADTPQRLMVKD